MGAHNGLYHDGGYIRCGVYVFKEHVLVQLVDVLQTFITLMDTLGGACLSSSIDFISISRSLENDMSIWIPLSNNATSEHIYDSLTFYSITKVNKPLQLNQHKTNYHSQQKQLETICFRNVRHAPSACFRVQLKKSQCLRNTCEVYVCNICDTQCVSCFQFIRIWRAVCQPCWNQGTPPT